MRGQLTKSKGMFTSTQINLECLRQPGSHCEREPCVPASERSTEGRLNAYGECRPRVYGSAKAEGNKVKEETSWRFS